VGKDAWVDPMKVLGWIRRGELRAVNGADQNGKRPRWRIPPEALDEFLCPGKRRHRCRSSGGKLLTCRSITRQPFRWACLAGSQANTCCVTARSRSSSIRLAIRCAIDESAWPIMLLTAGIFDSVGDSAKRMAQAVEAKAGLVQSEPDNQACGIHRIPDHR